MITLQAAIFGKKLLFKYVFCTRFQDYFKACANKMAKANVFIIESLDPDDEKDNKFEGKILSQILHLGSKKSKYRYIRTKKQLKKVLKSFGESGYRYLHLSCHGNETSISTTSDTLGFSELEKLMKPYLKDKRLFISACGAVNDDLAKTIIPSSKCFSIIGPAEDIFLVMRQ